MLTIADPSISSADSTANSGHPMIDPIWRGRLAIGDVLIPLHAGDPMVPLIRAAVRIHRRGRDAAAGLLRRLRGAREKHA